MLPAGTLRQVSGGLSAAKVEGKLLPSGLPHMERVWDQLGVGAMPGHK